MSARANFAPRRGVDAQLPAVIKALLTLLFSTLFLALVLLGERHAGSPSHAKPHTETPANGPGADVYSQREDVVDNAVNIKIGSNL
jgi:hypothetical protein